MLVVHIYKISEFQHMHLCVRHCTKSGEGQLCKKKLLFKYKTMCTVLCVSSAFYATEFSIYANMCSVH